VTAIACVKSTAKRSGQTRWTTADHLHTNSNCYTNRRRSGSSRLSNPTVLMQARMPNTLLLPFRQQSSSLNGADVSLRRDSAAHTAARASTATITAAFIDLLCKFSRHGQHTHGTKHGTYATRTGTHASTRAHVTSASMAPPVLDRTYPSRDLERTGQSAKLTTIPRTARGD
jgi:hypothetical protein